MYGALLVEKTDPRADMAVLFIHTAGKGCGNGCGLITGGDPCADMAVLLMHNKGIRGVIRGCVSLLAMPVVCIEPTRIYFFLCYSTMFLLSFCLPSVGGARPRGIDV